MPKKIKLDVDLICKQYLEGKSTNELAKIHGCSPNTVSRRLKEKNIIPHPKYSRGINFSEQETVKICEMYQSGKTTPEIAKIMNCCYQVISKTLKENNVPIGDNKPYSSFFDEINTPEQAWILGWIVSDGHIEKDCACFRIEIQKKDFEIISKITEIITGTPKVQYRKDGRVYLKICSKKIKEDLVRLGIPAGKKSLLVKPLNLSSEVISHFWRGVFEGDGTVGIFKHYNRKYPSINLSGNYEMCLGFAKYLGINTKIRLHKGNLSIIKKTYICKKGTNKLDFWQKTYSKLYDDYSIKKGLFLTRKHDIFLKIFNLVGADESYTLDRWTLVE